MISTSRTLSDKRVLVLYDGWYKIIDGKKWQTYPCKPYYDGQFDRLYNDINTGQWKPPVKSASK